MRQTVTPMDRRASAIAESLSTLALRGNNQVWFIEQSRIAMALLYRGAGPGTYWHLNDARVTGFAPHSSGATPSNDFIINHIARGSTRSPYVSFTRSFGVGRAYALSGPAGYASISQPGYVYEIEVVDDTVCTVLDPVVEIAKGLGEPWSSPSYHHDGKQNFLLGIVDPANCLHHLQEHCVMPPGSSGTPRAANLSRELEALVRALRDSELLVLGNIPSSFLRTRYAIY
jgi:hypothetical protein